MKDCRSLTSVSCREQSRRKSSVLFFRQFFWGQYEWGSVKVRYILIQTLKQLWTRRAWGWHLLTGTFELFQAVFSLESLLSTCGGGLIFYIRNLLFLTFFWFVLLSDRSSHCRRRASRLLERFSTISDNKRFPKGILIQPPTISRGELGYPNSSSDCVRKPSFCSPLFQYNVKNRRP